MSDLWTEAVLHWTARVAVAAYVVRAVHDLRAADAPSRRFLATDHGRGVLIVWNVGCVAMWLHIAWAFHSVHHWSHAAAYRHTAQQTAAVTGWDWGGGVWINYAFCLAWAADAVWSWRCGLERLPSWHGWVLHLVSGFLMFNATVVFGPPWWRWAGLAALLLLAGVFIGPRWPRGVSARTRGPARCEEPGPRSSAPRTGSDV